MTRMEKDMKDLDLQIEMIIIREESMWRPFDIIVVVVVVLQLKTTLF